MRAFVYSMITTVLRSLFGGFPLMLLAGVVNSYAPAVPALGYWESVWIVFLLLFLLGTIFASVAEDAYNAILVYADFRDGE